MDSATRSAIRLSDAVAKEIRVQLVRRDMTQVQLAARMGVSEMWLSRRLRSRQPLDLNDLEAIARVLNVGVVDLLPREMRVQTMVPNVGLPGRPRDNRPNGRPLRVATSPTSRRPVRVDPDASLIAA